MHCLIKYVPIGAFITVVVMCMDGTYEPKEIHYEEASKTSLQDIYKERTVEVRYAPYRKHFSGEFRHGLSAPIIKIFQPLPPDIFYEQGRKYELECCVKSFTQSNISWHLLSCTNWGNCSSDRKIENGLQRCEEWLNCSGEKKTGNGVKRCDNRSLSSTMFWTKLTLTVKANETGIFYCTVYNGIGRSENMHFIVTDIPGGLPAILKEERDMSSGDPKIKISCRITRLVYTHINWSFVPSSGSDAMDINNHPAFTIKKERHKHSETSILSFSPLANRSGNYVCTFIDKRSMTQIRKYLQVQINESSDLAASTAPAVQQNMIDFATFVIICIIILAVFLTLIANIITVPLKVRVFLWEWRKYLRYDPHGFHLGQPNLINPDLPLEEQVDLLPYNMKWEFPKENLRLGRIIGHGAFGRVVKADAIGLEPNVPRTTVAVKMLKDKSDDMQYKSLVAELKFMIHLGRHVNIVNLMGAVTRNLHRGELLVMVEYCCHGNLRSFLLRQRKKFINQIDPETGKVNREIIYVLAQEPNEGTQENDCTKQHSFCSLNPSYHYSSMDPDRTYIENTADSVISDTYLIGREATTGTVGNSKFGYGSTRELKALPFNGKEAARYSGFLTTSDLLCYCFQCAQGMAYLASRKLLHRDLAARNILLAEGNVIKISDFGLARDVLRYPEYVKKSDVPLPMKWMAIESITDSVFTIKSDVWSFGVVMWEIFTLGRSPYPGFDMSEYFVQLQDGYRMPKPEYSPAEVYQIMRGCWEEDPENRPEFSVLGEQLGNMLEESVKQHYLDLNRPCALLNSSLQNTDYLDMNIRDYVKMNTHLKETDIDKVPDYITAMDINSAQEQPKRAYYNIPASVNRQHPDKHVHDLESRDTSNTMLIETNCIKIDTSTEDNNV